jgi:transcriptional regulator
MYVPKTFRNDDKETQLAFIRQHSFAMLVSVAGGTPYVTHLPMMLEACADGQLQLTGHISIANPHAHILKETNEVLLVFTGPHTYISSSWYDHDNVPTWNYIAVHVTGKLHIQSTQELYASLQYMMDNLESSVAHPLSLKSLPEEMVADHLTGIIGFSVTLDKMEAAYKLSQNRDDKNYQHIITELEQRDAGSQEVAGEMKKLRP